jgi:hypothetical protein
MGIGRPTEEPPIGQLVPDGTVVEVLDAGSSKPDYALVVEQPTDAPAPNDHETFVWVRYANGCVVPVRAYRVYVVTAEQVVARLDELTRTQP